jgi:hypothetical protein
MVYTICLGLADPYVMMKNGQRLLFCTNVREKTINPVWEERFSLNEKLFVEDDISFYVFDHDLMSRHDRQGYFKYSLKELKQHRFFSNWILLKNVRTGSLRLTMIYVEDTSKYDACTLEILIIDFQIRKRNFQTNSILLRAYRRKFR